MTTFNPTMSEAQPAPQSESLAESAARPYVNPYHGGILLGVVLFLAFLLTGNGLGASGGMNRLVVTFEDMLVPHHVDRVPYLLEMAGGDKNPLDSWVVFVLIGAAVGGFTAGLRNKRLTMEINHGPRITKGQRLLFAFIGGAIMGYGARLARGCTSGQALSGGAVLSVGSWLFMFAVFAGGYALAYFVRRLWT